jgi:hypothetical protein
MLSVAAVFVAAWAALLLLLLLFRGHGYRFMRCASSKYAAVHTPMKTQAKPTPTCPWAAARPAG